MRTEWRKRSLLDAHHLIKSLYELLEIMSDFPARDPRRGMAIKEFAECYGKAEATVRDYLEKIKPYTYVFMVNAIHAGFTFDHFEKAQMYASAKQMTPPELITACLDMGNGEGKIMTVDEMTSFALGEKDTTGADSRNFRKWYDKLVQLPTAYKWDAEKKLRYLDWLKIGWEFFA
jgi:hypothetical protein